MRRNARWLLRPTRAGGLFGGLCIRREAVSHSRDEINEQAEQFEILTHGGNHCSGEFVFMQISKVGTEQLWCGNAVCCVPISEIRLLQLVVQNQTLIFSSWTISIGWLLSLRISLA